MVKKLFSDFRVLACHICYVLYDIDSLFLNSEVKNIKSILKLEIGQMLQWNIKAFKSRYVIVCNCKVKPFKTWKVLSANVCLLMTTWLIYRYLSHVVRTKSNVFIALIFIILGYVVVCCKYKLLIVTYNTWTRFWGAYFDIWANIESRWALIWRAGITLSKPILIIRYIGRTARSMIILCNSDLNNILVRWPCLN